MLGDSTEYGLVMPFVVTRSAGGPYDDRAFVAGYRAGQFDAQLAGLRSRTAGVELTIPTEPELIPQLDLIAMRHGLTLTTEPTSDPAWVTAVFHSTDHDPRARGELCQDCHTRYLTVYRLPDDVWTLIFPPPSHPGAGLLCPRCADDRARALNLPLTWTATRDD